jgi:hypothetical protein
MFQHAGAADRAMCPAGWGPLPRCMMQHARVQSNADVRQPLLRTCPRAVNMYTGMFSRDGVVKWSVTRGVSPAISRRPVHRSIFGRASSGWAMCLGTRTDASG